MHFRELEILVLEKGAVVRVGNSAPICIYIYFSNKAWTKNALKFHCVVT